MGAVSKTEKKKVRCRVCLGLGSYETNPKYKRPEMHYHMAVLHSSVKIEDAIAMLPEGEPTNE